MIKSQDELNTCNDGKRKSDVLLEAIAKCEKLEEENESLKQKINNMEGLIASFIESFIELSRNGKISQ